MKLYILRAVQVIQNATSQHIHQQTVKPHRDILPIK
jgi:hypothetical protein